MLLAPRQRSKQIASPAFYILSQVLPAAGVLLDKEQQPDRTVSRSARHATRDATYIQQQMREYKAAE